MIDTLSALNAKHALQETSNPREEYRVVFQEHPTFLRAHLIPMGARRETVQLSGVPENSDSCPFCTTSLKVFEVCSVIVSRSGQVLLIPDTHYVHWFEAPLEEQCTLMTHALELRKQYPKAIQTPIELHCGSAGYQTVFHLHLRTGIFL
jgi:hypothetical protein